MSTPDARDREIDRLSAENKRLREALTPSGTTKAAYIGEFSFFHQIGCYDEDGEWIEAIENVTVPWTTIKEIMSAIAARAALEGEALIAKEQEA